MSKKKLTDIGMFLRKLRFDHQENQEEMAKKLGVTAAYISLLESKQPVTKKIAMTIISAYGLSEKEKETFVDMVTRDIVKRFWGVKG
jgi:transcriptional regulator with XRE-family HTH domain